MTDQIFNRRMLIAGSGASVLTAGAARAADVPRAVLRHPGYQPWAKVAWPRPAPLNLPVQLPGGGQVSLAQWMGPGPTALILWASWCSPCIAEKPAQAFLSRRLRTVRSPAKLKLLQAFDDLQTEAAIAGLERFGARGLDVARATAPLEQAMIELFGPSRNDPRRTAMPSELLLGADGVELGRGRGSMISTSGQSYWGDVQTFQFLVALGQPGRV